jgi:hypothetical protein
LRVPREKYLVKLGRVVPKLAAPLTDAARPRHHHAMISKELDNEYRRNLHPHR